MDSRFDAFNPSATFEDGSCPTVMIGCMESGAANYRALANIDSGRCLYEGCMNPAALNYDPSADLPKGCIYRRPGCMDPVAVNYRSYANTADGSCRYAGCTDSFAINYNPSAMFNDGSCPPRFRGCTDSRALNYQSDANWDDGTCSIIGCKATDPSVTINLDICCSMPCLCTRTCSFGRRRKLGHNIDGDLCAAPEAINYWSGAKELGYPLSFLECVFASSGCTDSSASNYRADARTDDGGCIVPVHGCTDDAATNFDSTATVLDSCVYSFPGCADSVSTNYVRDASTDDGSCAYDTYGCIDADALNYDSTATVNAGCLARIEGCTVSSAKNFAADANVAANDECIYA